jgi:hypothetical protein
MESQREQPSSFHPALRDTQPEVKPEVQPEVKPEV